MVEITKYDADGTLITSSTGGGGSSSASDVSFTPAGDIAATNVQDAIEEVDSEKASTSHASTHERAGSDEIDGDHLDIDYTPSNYTPSTTPAEAANVDDLAAHLAGIDDAFGSAGGGGDTGASLYNNGSAYSINSTSFTDVDATNLSITLTTSGGDVLVSFSGAVSPGSTRTIGFDVDVDGTRWGAANTYGLAYITNLGNYRNTGFSVLITGLSAGSHTFKLQWRNDASGASLLQSTTGTVPVNFNAVEVG